MFSPSYFTEGCLSAFPFSFLIHSSLRGYDEVATRTPRLRHSVCILHSIWVGSSRLCGLGNAKK